MTKQYFGTDGIRGKANCYPMTAEIALKVGMAAAKYFIKTGHRNKVIIGKDPRLSGYMLEQALTAGFLSMGMDVLLVGPIPTPGVAMLTRAMRCDLGVMISASHNNYMDNGIKLFSPSGEKLDDSVEEEIEHLINTLGNDDLASGNLVGRASRIDDVLGRYIEFVKQTFPKELSLEGYRIVVDCSNGAAYKAAPAVLYELGAEVFPIGVEPNGKNINDKVGSTAPSAMKEAVKKYRADMGIALDGDADRLVAADEQGELIDGDQLMATIAVDLKERGLLQKNTLVATVMSNLGLERFLAAKNIALTRCNVGDRYVWQTMKDHGYNLGGEQSGHIVLSDYGSTGDGMVAALQVLAAMARKKKPASKVCRQFTPVPQVLVNTQYAKDTKPLTHDDVKAVIADIEKKLKNKGRVLIRASGTEPVIRIMLEGDDKKLIRQYAGDIKNAIQQASGLSTASLTS